MKAAVTFPRLQTLTLTNTTRVVSAAQLDMYLLPGTAAAPPTANTSLAPAPAEAGATVRLFKCDWRNYQTR